MNKPSYAESRFKAGFTLIEVMIMLAVIGVLAGILLGVFSRIQEKGRSAVCQSNLHQIYLGMQQYVQDNDSRYPHAWESNGSSWQHRIFPYIKNAQVFQCPSLAYLRKVPPSSYSPLNASDYTYNGVRLLIKELPRYGKRESAVNSNSATTFLNVCFVLSVSDEVASSCGRTMRSNGVRHHSGGTNWSFLDGHVKWMTLEQLAELDCVNPDPRPLTAR